MTLLQRYSLNFNKIDGWFLLDFIKEMEILNDIHNNLNIQGNILEIGVFNGKSFIPFSFLLKENEQIIGIDCFQKQEFNTSYSGGFCSQKRTEYHIKKIYVDKFKDLNYKLIKSDSKILTINNYNNFIKNYFNDTDGFSDNIRKVLKEYVTRIYGKNKSNFES